MIVAVDVQYEGDHHARAAAVAFDKWDAEKATHEWTVKLSPVAPYVPGQFYKRELPPLLAVLKAAPVSVRTVIVDGHVWLGMGRWGLGRHLHEALGETTPVIGVAKRPFQGGSAAEWVRGSSKTPLYVSVAGLHIATVQGYLCQMHGPYRLPTLIKRADTLARGFTISG